MKKVMVFRDNVFDRIYELENDVNEIFIPRNFWKINKEEYKHFIVDTTAKLTAINITNDGMLERIG
jgi:hypothetical protein